MNQPNGQPTQEAAADVLLLDNGRRLRKFYIGAICIFVAVVPLVIAAGIWLWMSISESRREVASFLVVRSVQVMNDVDSWLQEEYEIVEAIGSTLQLGHDDVATTRNTLMTLKGHVVRWKVMALYNANGELIEDTNGTSPGAIASDIARAVRQTAETRRPNLCTCVVTGDVNNANYGIHIFVPIVKSGEVRHVLSVVLAYSTIQRMVLTAAAPFYDVGILNQDDVLIARTNRDLSFRGQLAAEDFRVRDRFPTQMVGSFSGRTMTGNMSFASFSRSALTGWAVITATGADNVDALALQSRWALFAITGLCLILLAVLTIMILYNMLLRRVSIERMTASRALSDLQSRLLTTTHDALNKQSKAASEREVLLREIYHRVKNNLQIIQSLMRLGARNLSRDQQGPFDAAVRRIGAMARVHTLLYNSPDLASIDFKEYLSSIVAEISESFGAAARGIRTRLEVQAMPVPIDSAIPLAFISVELLANAFKHAFPEGRSGQVAISARIEGEFGILIISDDGIGIPEQDGKKKTLGLNLVGRLVEQIGGTLQMAGRGQSEYRITFPLEERKIEPAAQQS